MCASVVDGAGHLASHGDVPLRKERRATGWLAALLGWFAGRRAHEVPVVATSGRTAGADATAEPHPVSSPALATWIPPGADSVVVGGHHLTGGMLYVGEHLPPVAEPYEVEPALLDPRLRVDAAHAGHTGHAERCDDAMSCWPAYRELSPQHRAGFLGWLARGRRDPDADIGHVFLFFYGLERRLLADARRIPLSAAERSALEAEILALRDCYARSASFRGYAWGLLGAMWMGEDSAVHERLVPPDEPRAGELPLLLRLGLGQLVRDGRPIPAPWALSWALAHPDEPRPSFAAGGRATDALRERFGARYAEVFGEGLVRRPEGRELVVHYRPASASFGGGLVLGAPGVPDVTPMREPVERLRQLVQRCAEELSPASVSAAEQLDVEHGSA